MEFTGLALTKKIVKILDNKKGGDIKVIRINDISVLADYFVIVTGSSSTQVKSLADEVEYKLKHEDGVSPKSIEGHNSNTWIILDYNDVIVHVFYDETRKFYELERLWDDGENIDVASLIEE